MANELTGAFDVVAEFSVGAVNRVLAAMHRGKRFPHSLSLRVDDTPHSGGTRPVVDLFGSAILSRVVVGRTGQGDNPPKGGKFPGANGVSLLLNQVLDPLVNTKDGGTGGGFSHLQGVAQLQLAAPAISLPAGTTSTATVHLPAMARYFPDPNTMVLPQFLHGELQVTFGATKVSSPAGPFIHVDLAGQGGNIKFQQAGPQTLGASALHAVNAALGNALATGFQPSNTPLPPSVTNMQFFTMPAAGVVVLAMNMPGGHAPPGGVFGWNSLFLNGNDQFAVAVSADFIRVSILDTLNARLAPHRHQSLTNKVTINYLFGSYSFHIFTNITLDAATLEFQSGQMVLRIPGHVSVSSDSSIGPSLDSGFTVRQVFTLSLSGGQISLQPVGGIHVDVSSTILSILDNLIGDPITPHAQAVFNSAWSQASSSVQQQIRGKLGAEKLQGFLRNLMNPVVQQQNPPPEIVNPTLAYASIEIRPAGVVVHGSLAVPPWPQPHVEFDLNPSTVTAQHPEYNALNSWIPGGGIQSYVWSYQGSAMGPDHEKFISTNAPAVGLTAELNPVCVTVKGTRISASGPITMQPVSWQLCKGLLTTMAAMADAQQPHQPDVGLTQLSATGKLEIVAHATPWAPKGVSAGGTANLLVHFPDDKSLAHLDLLARGLAESGRKDTATGIIAVVTPEQLGRVKPDTPVSFADDTAGWENLLQVKHRPATYLFGTTGKVVWEHSGALTSDELAAALRKALSPRGYMVPRVLEASLRVGQRAPNFLFEYSPGKDLTLRKLDGRPVILVFWKSSSKPSLDTLGNLHKALSQPGMEAPVLLAIDGGADPEFAKGMSAGNGFSAILVPDPKHQICDAYGVTVWPTTFLLDASGLVQEIRQGLITEEQSAPDAVTAKR